MYTKYTYNNQHVAAVSINTTWIILKVYTLTLYLIVNPYLEVFMCIENLPSVWTFRGKEGAHNTNNTPENGENRDGNE